MIAVQPDAGRLRAGVVVAGDVVLPGAERRLTRVEPTWTTTMCGTRTPNQAGRTVVMDECREVRRSLLRPRAGSLLA